MIQLNKKIVAAFGARPKPADLVDLSAIGDTDKEDALRLGEFDWQELTWETWTTNRGAFHALRPEAFKYYLPSILTLALEKPEQWFFPADSLVSILDRSPMTAYWDDFLTARLLGLEPAEYEVVLEWLLFVADYGVLAEEASFDRAFETICLLQKETASAVR